MSLMVHALGEVVSTDCPTLYKGKQSSIRKQDFVIVCCCVRFVFFFFNNIEDRTKRLEALQ